MILIVGGQGQGKLAYAMERYNVSPEEVDCALGENRIVNSLHQLIRSMPDPEWAAKLVLEHAQLHPEAIYICDEVGCGVVPADKRERAWREAVGRTCVALAGEARRVERIFCGIPMVLKGETEED